MAARQSTIAAGLLMPYIDGCLATSRRLGSEHSDWAETDVGITVFRKCAGVALNTVVLLKCREKYIGLPPKPVCFPRASLGSQANDLKNLDMFVKLSFFLGVFIAVESSLRCVFRKLRPGQRDGGTGTFHGVYEDILGDCGQAKYGNLLDVLRHLRNAIHNNMAHFDKRGRDRTIVWDGQSYSFVHGKAVDWVTWETLIRLLTDARGAMAEIIGSPCVSALRDIEDGVIADG